ncbi:MAG TPA: L,D-transpeptidase, partial [Phycisphaerae bacterium]|nr:L,D-transpeptidase [Phycisphaerae bacterium]
SPPPPPPAPPPAPPAPPKLNLNKQLRVNLAWQIALDAANFSPGILDGHFKRKSLMALSDYRDRFFPSPAGFAPNSPFDPKIFHALNVDVDGAVTTYEITADDAAQVGMVPEDWNEKAKLDRLPYESLAECMGEKFHCTKVLLETLNPGLKLDSLQPGQIINVPNIRPFPEDNKVVVLHNWSNTGSVTVDLAQKTVRVFDRDGNELALFHCSIAKDKAKLPDRDTKVQVIAAPNPQYTFRPEMWPDVKDVTQTLQIPAGPRNPVGLAWVGLDLPGYGIHGTPKPELIGKTGSHGCFRLTNWDALKFAGMVQVGTPVKVVNPEKGAEQ